MSTHLIFLSLGTALDPTLKAPYTATSQRIRKCIIALHYFYIFVVPVLCIVPSFLISFHLYFTTDLGNDALELLNPLW